MKLFDLHCDTIYECTVKGKNLHRNDLHLDLERGLAALSEWVQTFAFWIPDELPEKEQYALYQKELARFQDFAAQYPVLQPYHGEDKTGVCQYLLAVEGGGMLGGDLDRLEELKRAGVTFLTLTWNGENRIGGGAKSDARLTDFGKSVIREAERCGIVIDLSHLNRKTFWDVCKVAEKPFVATHSNADGVCSNLRNLDDDQIREIVQRGGLIGLNLFHEFLSSATDCTVTDFLRHIEYFLELDAGDCLAIGTDFDGAVMPIWINGVEGIEMLAQDVVKWYGTTVCSRIFYENARRFYQGLKNR